jgi:nucleoside phosphorylase
MASPSPPRDRRGFEIALICALRVEADCVLATFDKFWEDEGERYGQAPGDENSYTTGMIGEHNVVLAYMPNIGKVGASGVAASLRFSFPEIRLALVVGICGGVPFGTNKEEILLGDIIISRALVQYDFGKQYAEGFEEKDTLEDNLGRPSKRIRGFLTKLQTYHYRSRVQNGISLYLKELQQKLPKVKYPGAEADKLYEPSYLHKHHKPVMPCDECAKGEIQICQAARGMTCEELACEERKVVVRSRLAKTQNLQQADHPEQHEPMVHFGRMGSGDTVMKWAERRDKIAKTKGVIAFEMEGAGVWDHLPSIVIKGVCDYADSHKNDRWHDYAASTAAACMKAFLKEWTAENRFPEQG